MDGLRQRTGPLAGDPFQGFGASEDLGGVEEGRTVGESSREAAGNAINYLRSAEEMWDVFGDEYPESLTNTLKIAEMCDLDLPQGLIVGPGKSLIGRIGNQMSLRETLPHQVRTAVARGVIHHPDFA